MISWASGIAKIQKRLRWWWLKEFDHFILK